MEDRKEGETLVKSGAERARTHRERKKGKDVQIAVGVAKLVLGQGPGEQKAAIAGLLERAAESDDLPGNYASLISRALAALASQAVF
jgi:hypothetical protein